MEAEDQIEIHRDRWLTLFTNGYAMIGVVAGIGVGVASSIDGDDAAFARSAAILSGLVCVLSIVLLFWGLRRFYDWMGFGKQPVTEEDLKAYKIEGDNHANRGKKIRIFLEAFIHLMLLAHIAFLAF